MTSLSFSGHESFNCRPLWLKKGIDFINSKGKFTSEDALVTLGVGKNMVNSIYYWLSVFGLIEKENKLSQFANLIFTQKEKDPFLEDSATLWLLHYYLVKTERASLYNIFFNTFKKERLEFNSIILTNYLNSYVAFFNKAINPNTIDRDINVFLKTYVKPIKSNKNLDEEYSGLFIELNLIEKLDLFDNGAQWYRIVLSDRKEIPEEILLFMILDQIGDSKSFSLQSLLHEKNSVGNITGITEEGLIDTIQKLSKRYHQIVFSDNSGIKEIQLKKTLNKWSILDSYYGKNV